MKCWNSTSFSKSLPTLYEGVSKSLRTGRLERELHIVQLSATAYSCIAILWVILVSFAAITVHVASQRVFIVVSVFFVIDLVRKLLVTPSYMVIFPLHSTKHRLKSLFTVDVRWQFSVHRYPVQWQLTHIDRSRSWVETEATAGMLWWRWNTTRKCP